MDVGSKPFRRFFGAQTIKCHEWSRQEGAMRRSPGGESKPWLWSAKLNPVRASTRSKERSSVCSEGVESQRGGREGRFPTAGCWVSEVIGEIWMVGHCSYDYDDPNLIYQYITGG